MKYKKILQLQVYEYIKNKILNNNMLYLKMIIQLKFQEIENLKNAYKK